MKIVFNELVRDKMETLKITRRQANFVITRADRKRSCDGIFEVEKYMDGRLILIRYTRQCAEIKIASIDAH